MVAIKWSVTKSVVISCLCYSCYFWGALYVCWPGALLCTCRSPALGIAYGTLLPGWPSCTCSLESCRKVPCMADAACSGVKGRGPWYACKDLGLSSVLFLGWCRSMPFISTILYLTTRHTTTEGHNLSNQRWTDKLKVLVYLLHMVNTPYQY